MGAAGGLLSEIADFKLKADQQELAEMQADRMFQLEKEAVQSQKDKISTEVELESIKQYGAPIYTVDPDTMDIVQQKDIFEGAKHPITGKPIYDVTPEQELDVKVGLQEVEATYSQLPGHDPADKEKAISGVYNKLGIKPRQQLSSKYAGLSYEMTEDGTPRFVPLSEKQTEKQTVGAIKQIDATTEATMMINIGKHNLDMSGWKEKTAIQKVNELDKLEFATEQDLKKIAATGAISLNELRITQEFKEQMEKEGRDWKIQYQENEFKWKSKEAEFDRDLRTYLQTENLSWQQMMSRQSLEDKKLMTKLETKYQKELLELGHANALELKKLGLESALEVTQYLEEQKMIRKQFDNDSEWMRYLQTRKYVEEGRDYDKAWWKEQQGIVNEMKLAEEERKKYQSAQIALADQNLEILKPLNLGRWTGQWETSWMGFDEGEWLAKMKENFLAPAQSLIEPLKDSASMKGVDGKTINDPLIEQFLANIRALKKTMGDPEKTMELNGVKVNFYNDTDWDAGDARATYQSLLNLETVILDAKK